MTAASFALLGWAFGTFIFSVAAFGALGRLLRRAWSIEAAGRAAWPSIAILRPCEGLDEGLHDNLLSAVTARYDGTREVWILVPSEADPAWPVARAVADEARARAPEVPVHVLATSIDTFANRKVAQLARAQASTEVVVVADSDLRFDDETLPALVGALTGDPRAGAASAAYLEESGTLGDYASAALLTSTPHSFFCLAALAERSGGAHVLAGGLVALWRRVLDEIGGFASLESFLGEDFELARRLHARGYTIPTSPRPAVITDRGRSLGWVLRRFARWCTVTRQQRAHLFPTYVLLLGATPLLVVAAVALLLLRAPYAGWAALAVAIAAAVRLALATRLRRAYRLPADPLRSLFALLAGELLIVISTFGALGRPIVEWRGKRYYVGRGGVLRRLS